METEREFSLEYRPSFPGQFSLLRIRVGAKSAGPGIRVATRTHQSLHTLGVCLRASHLLHLPRPVSSCVTWEWYPFEIANGRTKFAHARHTQEAHHKCQCYSYHRYQTGDGLWAQFLHLLATRYQLRIPKSTLHYCIFGGRGEEFLIISRPSLKTNLRCRKCLHDTPK